MCAATVGAGGGGAQCRLPGFGFRSDTLNQIPVVGVTGSQHQSDASLELDGLDVGFECCDNERDCVDVEPILQNLVELDVHKFVVRAVDSAIAHDHFLPVVCHCMYYYT